jgi:2-polyprenyl-6-methoxyphenol hydroxylase-like FAD-dependent oxidoreductase
VHRDGSTAHENWSTAPIVVIGGGPVGLVLALFLDHYGVRCTVVNDGLTPSDVPRGSTHNARTMEHFRRLGIAEGVRELGLPADHPTDVAYFTRYNGFELARLPMPSTKEKRRAVELAPDTDQTPEPLQRVNQMYVERLLADQARQRPGITLRFGWRVTEVRQDDSGVVLRAEHTHDGTVRTWRTQYVVGCDGSQSVVRAAIGAGYAGSGGVDQEILGRRASAIHLRIPTLHRDFLADRRAWSYWALNHELAINLITLDGADEFFLLTSSIDPADLDPGRAIELVRRAAGACVPVDVLGHRAWTPGLALVADRFADRRVLLAGDAAHLFTPTGGFGMNTGIDDVANLSWKLAAVLAGWGGARLLDSYERERRPIAVRNTSAARQLNKNLGKIKPTAVLERDSRAGQAERARIGALLSTFGEQFGSIGVQLGARYDGSPIISADGDPPPDSLAGYRPTSVPGGRAPHVWCTDRRGRGDSLFDRFGTGFTLLRLGSEPPDVAPVVAAARDGGIPLTVLTIADPMIRDMYQRDLVLIRPDQHVAWRGNRTPDDADGLLALATGR